VAVLVEGLANHGDPVDVWGEPAIDPKIGPFAQLAEVIEFLPHGGEAVPALYGPPLGVQERLQNRQPAGIVFLAKAVAAILDGRRSAAPIQVTNFAIPALRGPADGDVGRAGCSPRPRKAALIREMAGARGLTVSRVMKDPQNPASCIGGNFLRDLALIVVLV